MQELANIGARSEHPCVAVCPHVCEPLIVDAAKSQASDMGILELLFGVQSDMEESRCRAARGARGLTARQWQGQGQGQRQGQGVQGHSVNSAPSQAVAHVHVGAASPLGVLVAGRWSPIM